MSNPNPAHSTVQRTRLNANRVAAALLFLDNVCAAGAQCAQVQSDPVAKQALADLQTTVTAVHAAVANKGGLQMSLTAATKTLGAEVSVVENAIGTYETAVDVVADGSAALIAHAGLFSRLEKTPPAALGVVTIVESAPGKNAKEAILRWPAVPRATNYAVEVNLTPQSPAGPWTSLGTGKNRRRVVTGPAPKSQLLARVAAVGSDGTQTAWSDAILVTTA